jgi:hypothetical protein
MRCVLQKVPSIAILRDERGAVLEASALAGKRSLRLTAVLKLMRRA